jgi:hypothetical protein
MDVPTTSPGLMRERWLEEWVSYGFRQMGEYLAKQAAFARYCEQRAKVSGGDLPGSPR